MPAEASRGDEIFAPRVGAQTFGDIAGERGHGFTAYELGEKRQFASLVGRVRAGPPGCFGGRRFEICLHHRVG